MKVTDVLLHLARNLSARPDRPSVPAGVGPAARAIESQWSQRVPDEAPRAKLLWPKDDPCMQEPVLEPRFQEVVRDIAEGGDIPGIPVRDQASATHASPSGRGLGTPTGAIPG